MRPRILVDLARIVTISVALLALTAMPRTAFAQERRIEAAAKDALKRARADYESSDFDTAVIRLRKAIKACGTIRCTPPVRAQLHRSLGAMQVKRGDKAAAAQSFAEALHIDPKVALGPPFEDAGDVRSEWNASRDEAAAMSQEQPAGDFETQPTSEQVENTPVPIYVEYVGSQKVDSVVAKYHGEGESDWKKISLARHGKGWGGLVPCGDVRRGVLRYYVQGFDSSGAPIALSGDLKHPFAVPIRHAIAGLPPSLPGDTPPAKCSPSGGCPASQPNCDEPSSVATSETVPQCEDDSQCSSGVCEDGRCIEKTASGGPRGFAHWWIGVAASVDIVSLPGATDVCKLGSNAQPANSSGYYCTYPNGVDYPSRTSANENNSLTQGQAGNVNGGPGFGAVRVMLSVDYAFSASVLAGVRFGYVAGGYPGTAATSDGHGFTKPIYGELRATYLFGDQPLAHSGFAPMLFAGGGIGEFAEKTDITVRQNGQPLPIPGEVPRIAWLVGGPVFVDVGGGVRYAFSQRIAFLGDLKVSAAFGGSTTLAVSPEIAVQYGF